MRLRTLLFALLGSCLDPTEIMVEVTTDFDCPSLRTNLFVGGPEALTTSAVSATKDTCAMHRVGDLVIVPRAGNKDAPVYVRVIAAVDGTTLDDCMKDPAARPMGSKCIDAKRIVRYVSHTRLRIPIVLTQSCINVTCGADTCQDGRCVDPGCMDPSCMDAGIVPPPMDSGPPPIQAQAIAAGFENACALVSGKLECWGANDTQQLGPMYSGAAVTSIPMPNGFQTITEIAIGGGHICANDGARIACWGNNSDGQLGNGLNAGGTVIAPTVTKAPNGTWPQPLRNLVAERVFTCVIANVQTFCWGQDGWSFYGGNPSRFTGDPGFTSIATGRSHACGVSGGSVYCWGDNSANQLGEVGPQGENTPVMVGAFAKADLVVAGFDHSGARAGSNKNLFLWGRNADREVNPAITDGLPLAMPQQVTPSALPVVMGESHVCILDAMNVRCRGGSKDGQLGPMTTKNGDWWDVPIGEPVTNIAAGRAHTCALGASGAVYCWGAAPAGPGSNQPKRIAL